MENENNSGSSQSFKEINQFLDKQIKYQERKQALLKAQDERNEKQIKDLKNQLAFLEKGGKNKAL